MNIQTQTESLRDNLNALLTAINKITNKTDTDIVKAIKSLREQSSGGGLDPAQKQAIIRELNIFRGLINQIYGVDEDSDEYVPFLEDSSDISDIINTLALIENAYVEFYIKIEELTEKLNEATGGTGSLGFDSVIGGVDIIIGENENLKDQLLSFPAYPYISCTKHTYIHAEDWLTTSTGGLGDSFSNTYAPAVNDGYPRLYYVVNVNPSGIYREFRSMLLARNNTIGSYTYINGQMWRGNYEENRNPASDAAVFIEAGKKIVVYEYKFENLERWSRNYEDN